MTNKQRIDLDRIAKEMVSEVFKNNSNTWNTTDDEVKELLIKKLMKSTSNTKKDVTKALRTAINANYRRFSKTKKSDDLWQKRTKLAEPPQTNSRFSDLSNEISSKSSTFSSSDHGRLKNQSKSTFSTYNTLDTSFEGDDYFTTNNDDDDHHHQNYTSDSYETSLNDRDPVLSTPPRNNNNYSRSNSNSDEFQIDVNDQLLLPTKINPSGNNFLNSTWDMNVRTTNRGYDPRTGSITNQYNNNRSNVPGGPIIRDQPSSNDRNALNHQQQQQQHSNSLNNLQNLLNGCSDIERLSLNAALGPLLQSTSLNPEKEQKIMNFITQIRKVITNDDFDDQNFNNRPPVDNSRLNQSTGIYNDPRNGNLSHSRSTNVSNYFNDPRNNSYNNNNSNDSRHSNTNFNDPRVDSQRNFNDPRFSSSNNSSSYNDSSRNGNSFSSWETTDDRDQSSTSNSWDNNYSRYDNNTNNDYDRRPSSSSSSSRRSTIDDHYRDSRSDRDSRRSSRDRDSRRSSMDDHSRDSRSDRDSRRSSRDRDSRRSSGDYDSRRTDRDSIRSSRDHDRDHDSRRSSERRSSHDISSRSSETSSNRRESGGNSSSSWQTPSNSSSSASSSSWQTQNSARSSSSSSSSWNTAENSNVNTSTNETEFVIDFSKINGLEEKSSSKVKEKQEEKECYKEIKEFLQYLGKSGSALPKVSQIKSNVIKWKESKLFHDIEDLLIRAELAGYCYICGDLESSDCWICPAFEYSSKILNSNSTFNLISELFLSRSEIEILLSKKSIEKAVGFWVRVAISKDPDSGSTRYALAFIDKIIDDNNNRDDNNHIKLSLRLPNVEKIEIFDLECISQRRFCQREFQTWKYNINLDKKFRFNPESELERVKSKAILFS